MSLFLFCRDCNIISFRFASNCLCLLDMALFLSDGSIFGIMLLKFCIVQLTFCNQFMPINSCESSHSIVNFFRFRTFFFRLRLYFYLSANFRFSPTDVLVFLRLSVLFSVCLQLLYLVVKL